MLSCAGPAWYLGGVYWLHQHQPNGGVVVIEYSGIYSLKAHILSLFINIFWFTWQSSFFNILCTIFLKDAQLYSKGIIRDFFHRSPALQLVQHFYVRWYKFSLSITFLERWKLGQVHLAYNLWQIMIERRNCSYLQRKGVEPVLHGCKYYAIKVI